MKLNRDNYEEYFILYLDNELDSESRREVETFAEANPDLKAELDLLLQSKLAPDTAVSFSDKDSLMRFHHSTISLANYEEWLIAYIDNELPEEERKDAERFIAGNPSIQRELNLLQRTKLQPEAIVFPYKESLYRKEEKARVIPVRWWRIAAAAVLLFAITTTTIVLINNNNGNSGSGPVVSTPPEKKSENNTAVNQPKDEAPVSTQVNDENDQKKPEEERKDQNSLIAEKPNNTKPEEKKNQIEPVKNNEPVIVKNNDKRSSNDPDQPTNNPNINSKTVTGDATASTRVDDPSLTKRDGNSKVDDVTTTTPETSIISDGPDNQVKKTDAEFASINSSNGQKGGVRGFLRKVTRTFEKRTNIKATDDDDRLLIAGLAIKL